MTKDELREHGRIQAYADLVLRTEGFAHLAINEDMILDPSRVDLCVAKYFNDDWVKFERYVIGYAVS